MPMQEFIYEKTLYELLHLKGLLSIPSLHTPLLHCARAVYPEGLLTVSDRNIDDMMASAFEILDFLKARSKNLIALGMKNFEIYSRRMAFRHFCEKKFLLHQDREYLLTSDFWEELLGYGLLWKLYKSGVLSIESYPAQTTVCTQGATESTLFFNLTPLEVYFNGEKINTVLEHSILGEGAILGIPRGTELKTPDISRVEHLVAILDCELLKQKMAPFHETLRLEIFISFLEKLQNTNDRIIEAINKFRQLNISYKDVLEKNIPKVKPQQFPLETFQRSELFHGITIPGKEARLKQYLKKILHVEEFQRGEVIIPIDSRPEKIFVVHNGSLSIRGAEGDVISFAHSGDVLGESIITGTPTIAQVVAEEPTVIVAIYRDDVLASALKKLFFFNCFKILQNKLTRANHFRTQLNCLIKEQEKKEVTKMGNPVPHSSIPPRTRTLPRVSPNLSPFFEKSNQKQQKPTAQQKTKVPSSSAPDSPLRKLTPAIGSNLNNWLGDDV